MTKDLHIETPHRLSKGRLIMSFSGWMDGGDVSTGTVRGLVDELAAQRVAHIDPSGFFVYNFPGDMEVTATFRPEIAVEDGCVKKCEMAKSEFFVDDVRQLAFFMGREPNLRWHEFADCVFEFVDAFGIEAIYFVGSFAGSVPHTREPRLHVAFSDPSLKEELLQYGLRPTNYEGPGSFMTFLMTQATARGVKMVNIAAEIPSYLKGVNPSSIEVVTRRLAAILGLEVDLSPLRSTSNDWESRVSDAVQHDEDLVEQIRRLEEEYDDDLIDASSGDGLQGLESFGRADEDE